MKRLITHLVGDYVLQSDWEANTKTKCSGEGWAAALAHAGTYTACFLPLTRNWKALSIIGGTHLLLDHFRPLPKVMDVKNSLASPPGYVSGEFPFWLHIVVDNTVHLLINELTLDRLARK